jgi:UDP-N-acetylmuramate--alanine ligase
VPKVDDMAAHLHGLARPGDLIMTFGAGTITNVGPQFLGL